MHHQQVNLIRNLRQFLINNFQIIFLIREILNAGHNRTKPLDSILKEITTLIINRIEMLLDKLAQSINIIFLSLQKLSFKFLRVDLIDRDLLDILEVFVESVEDCIVKLY